MTIDNTSARLASSARQGPAFADRSAEKIDTIRAFISGASFSCVGAKSALNKGRMRFGNFGRLGDPGEAGKLCDALSAFSDEFPAPGTAPVTFVALFESEDTKEQDFERQLWQQLQAMHDVDTARGLGWDPMVSDDPNHEEFSFSSGGRAFFVVGLHPRASRLARRAPLPCLVFNFHDQFELLKAAGKYQSMQQAIRARELTLQGSINPVLSRFGESSEARQYSGRAVEDSWKCPFRARSN